MGKVLHNTESPRIVSIRDIFTHLFFRGDSSSYSDFTHLVLFWGRSKIVDVIAFRVPPIESGALLGVLLADLELNTL